MVEFLGWCVAIPLMFWIGTFIISLFAGTVIAVKSKYSNNNFIHKPVNNSIVTNNKNNSLKICHNCGFDYSNTPDAKACFQCHVKLKDYKKGLKICPYCGFDYSNFPYAKVCFRCNKNFK